MNVDTSNFGLSPSLDYLEIQLDSAETPISFSSSVEATNGPVFYLNQDLSNIAAIKILEAQIPFTYYVFNSSNNKFLLTVETICTNAVVTIPVGNYTCNSILPFLKDALDNAMLTQSSTLARFTVSYLGGSFYPNTGKFKFELSESKTVNFEFSSLYDTPRLMLGFKTGINSGTAGLLIAPNVAVITGQNYLYVNSKKLGTSVNMFLPLGLNNQGGIGSQICRIPVDVMPGEVIYYKDPDPSKWFDTENLINLNDFDIFLTPGNDKPVLDLNGVAFSIKLGVLVHKKSASNVMNGGSMIYQRLNSRN